MQVITAKQLDSMSCSTPGCTASHENGAAFYLQGRCHPDAPTWTYYQDGYITVECAVCREMVARMAVI